MILAQPEDMLRHVPDRSAGALGEIIRRQRELAGLSVRQFADRVGISNPYLSQIERGLRAPSEHVLDAIASALKLRVEALYEQAGLAPGGVRRGSDGVLEAIAGSDRLTARQRAALREIYQAFVSTGPAGRRRRA